MLNDPPVVGRIHCKGENVVSCLSLTNTCLVSLVCDFGMLGMMWLQAQLQFLHLVEASILLSPIGACSTPLGKDMQRNRNDYWRFKRKKLLFSFAFLCLFNNKPKVVISRNRIWSPLLFGFSVHLERLRQTIYLRTNLLSQRILWCTSVWYYTKAEKIFMGELTKQCVYICAQPWMHVDSLCRTKSFYDG